MSAHYSPQFLISKHLDIGCGKYSFCKIKVQNIETYPNIAEDHPNTSDDYRKSAETSEDYIVLNSTESCVQNNINIFNSSRPN